MRVFPARIDYKYPEEILHLMKTRDGYTEFYLKEHKKIIGRRI